MPKVKSLDNFLVNWMPNTDYKFNLNKEVVVLEGGLTNFNLPTGWNIRVI